MKPLLAEAFACPISFVALMSLVLARFPCSEDEKLGKSYEARHYLGKVAGDSLRHRTFKRSTTQSALETPCVRSIRVLFQCELQLRIAGPRFLPDHGFILCCTFVDHVHDLHQHGHHFSHNAHTTVRRNFCQVAETLERSG